MISPYAVLSLLFPMALVAGVIWLVVWTNRRRRAFQMQRAGQVAAAGWYPVMPNQWLLQVAEGLFPQGSPGDLGETYAGEYYGRGLCVLDYNYVVSNGKTQSTRTANLVALTLPVALPPVTVMRETGLRRMFRGHDLQLENEQFNERFRVECTDDRYGSAVMHPRMMEAVLANPGLEWQIAGNAFISWSHGGFTVPDVYARLQAMTQLIDLIPPFVLRDYGGPVS
ncbi:MULTISPECIES: DUF3137 domain-containing protein [Kribbella]|uniref:DUF3137 domain-containing protein n=1 Tax=Kribbella karoonensis TaxID=324851 RepID=A0ABN2DU58_9ACTN